MDLVFSNKAGGNLEDELKWGIHGGMPSQRKTLGGREQRARVVFRKY